MSELTRLKVDYVLVGLPGKDPDRLDDYVARWLSTAETLKCMSTDGRLAIVWAGMNYTLYRIIRP